MYRIILLSLILLITGCQSSNNPTLSPKQQLTKDLDTVRGNIENIRKARQAGIIDTETEFLNEKNQQIGQLYMKWGGNEAAMRIIDSYIAGTGINDPKIDAAYASPVEIAVNEYVQKNPSASVLLRPTGNQIQDQENKRKLLIMIFSEDEYRNIIQSREKATQALTEEINRKSYQPH